MMKSAMYKLKSLGPLFTLTVTIPFVISALYFGIFASDIYISESMFVVRSPEKQSPAGLGLLLRSTGIGSSSEEVDSAIIYVASRDALSDVEKSLKVSNRYSSDEISIFDRFAPFGVKDTFEDLYVYFQNHVKIEHDSASSAAKLSVKAYTAKDAQQINQRLLDLSEQLVNRLNARAQADLVQFAQKEVEEAEIKAARASLALSQYRNQEGVVDPEQQAQVQLQLISKLQDELISTKTQLTELRSYTPKNPQIEVLNTRVSELSREIDSQMGMIAGNRKSLSSTLARYERLQLENKFADRQLASALASLTDAKREARRKQVYVERLVQPNLPDKPLEPRRLRGMLATLILGLVAWGILSLLLAGIKEHNG